MPLDPKQQPPYYTPATTNPPQTPSTRYVTLLNQAATANPTQTILSNNTGRTITLTRDNVGVYSATVSPALIINKTTIICNNGLIATHDVHARIATTTSLEITTSVSATPTDGLLTNITMIIEIFE